MAKRGRKPGYGTMGRLSIREDYCYDHARYLPCEKCEAAKKDAEEKERKEKEDVAKGRKDEICFDCMDESDRYGYDRLCKRHLEIELERIDRKETGR